MPEEEQVNVWNASSTYIEPVSKLLKSLQHNRFQAYLRVSSQGVHVQTHAASRTFNSHLFLDLGLFTDYSVTSPHVEFRLSLHALVHCLQMFMEWSSPEDHPPADPLACDFNYLEGRSLQLSFDYETLSSSCDLTVYEAEGNDVDNDILFDSNKVTLQVILPASVFLAMMGDLEAIFAVEVSFSVSITPPQLEVRGTGEFALTEFVVPNDPNLLDAIAAESNATFSYDFNSLSKCKEAVKLANRVSLRFDSAGVLNLQCLCEIEEHNSYIEFRFLPRL